MISGDATAKLTFNGNATQGSSSVVAVTGQPFQKALRLMANVRSVNIWDLQATANCDGPLKQGDVLLATFYIRAIQGQAETGEARTSFVFEQQGEPWTKYADQEVSAGKEWKRIFIPIEMRQAAPPTGTHVCLRLGYGKQTFEIADFQFLNFGSSVKMEDLPRTRATYQGMEENAPWRKEAEARIEKIRKGDIAVVVKDASGKTVPNANVSLQMRRHAFGFGSAVSEAMISSQTPDGEKYRDWVTKYCSKVVIENDLKWPNFEENPERAKRVVKWLNDHDIPVRGHNLVWPSYRNSPKDLPSLAGDKAKLAKRINDHIVQETTAFKGQLVEWDVVNEPFDNHDVQDVLGDDVLVQWFKLVKSIDPKPRLTLNDYPPLDGSATENAHLNHFYKTLSTLKAKGAPLEGIGFQGHFGGTMIAPKNVLSGLDRFGKLGLPISITEFDMNTTDAGIQSAYMRDFMTAAFSHPSVDTIIMWGFWEGAHWLPDAALFRKDWTLRPHGQVYQDLITKTWWTNASGITDNKGSYKTRGFYGDYQVTVTSPKGGSKTVPAKLTKGANNVIVVTL
jgi:GH35 family endo-1,4-beta-xylanase